MPKLNEEDLPEVRSLVFGALKSATDRNEPVIVAAGAGYAERLTAMLKLRRQVKPDATLRAINQLISDKQVTETRTSILVHDSPSDPVRLDALRYEPAF